MPTQPRGKSRTFQCRWLASLIAAFHVMKLGGIAVNLAMFPALRAAAAGAPGRRS